MIAIVNYDTGNIRSVINALKRIGADEWVYTDKESILRSADHVLLPGVGEASGAMQKLKERGLDEVIPTLTCPVLGICIGTQLMCRYSEESQTQGMGIFDTEVRRFEKTQETGPDGNLISLKIPHMGWNSIDALTGPLFRGIPEESFIYYVHSYYPALCRETIAQSHHGCTFSAALGRENFFGTQFHPEKSGRIGAEILKNFLDIR